MLSATTSPNKHQQQQRGGGLGGPSIITERLQEAEALDAHLHELEQARKELLLQERQRRGPAPLPPPRPPSSTTPSIVEDTIAPPTAQQLRRVLELAPEYISDESSLQNLRELIAEIESNDLKPAQELALRKQGPAASSLVCQNSRFWEAVITSATVRHGRVEYEIRSQLTSSRTTGTSVVRRRYRDFARLRKALVKTCADYVLIPALPPKEVLQWSQGRTDPDFVWDRRVGLQFWLRFVFEHQVIRTSSLLREFLWEPSSAAVSNAETKRFEDHNVAAEQRLWKLALETQTQCVAARFGNDIVALTSMQLRIGAQIRALNTCAQRCRALIARDEAQSRTLQEASLRFASFAQSEISSGQNFTFLNRFSSCLPAMDVNRPVPEESFLVSFKTHEHFVDAPIALGSHCDVRSFKALGALLSMWGKDILPSLQSRFVPPECISPSSNAAQNRKKEDEAHRVACEWVEMERLQLGMVRDCLGRFVCDQIKHAQEERERWEQVVEAIRAQEVEMSSFFVTLGEASSSVTKSSDRAPSPNHHHIQQQQQAEGGSPSCALPAHNSRREHAALSSSASDSEEVHHFQPLLLQQELDSDLDKVQARFETEMQHDAPTSSFLLHANNTSSGSGFLNPFDDE